MLLVVIFGFIVYTIDANQQVTIVLQTSREVINQTHYDEVDNSPMKLSVKLVSYTGSPLGTLKPSLCNGNDDIKITMPGCTTPNGEECVPRTKAAQKNSDTVNVSYASQIENGVTSCLITVAFPLGTKMLTISDVVFKFNDPSFFASHILLNLTTTNDNVTTPVWGNGNIYEAVTAPTINDVLRKTAVVDIVSTVNYVENCYTLKIDTDKTVSWIQTTQNNCSFDSRSLKEFSLASKGSSPVSNVDFYSTLNDFSYLLDVRMTKGEYWKHTQLSLYVNIGQVVVWIILFALGLVGIFQIMRELIIYVVPSIIKLRGKYASYPYYTSRTEMPATTPHRDTNSALELKELKVESPPNTTDLETKP